MQKALRHSAGGAAALAFFKLTGNADEAKRAIDRLMKYAAELERPSNLHLLVGVGRKLAKAWIADEEGFRASLPKGGADVVVQVAAMTHADRLHGLRAAAYFLDGPLRLESESFGDRILDGLEPFGFGGGWSAPDASSLERGAYLLHLRYEQKLKRFLDQKAERLPEKFEKATDAQKAILKRLWPRTAVVGAVPASIQEPEGVPANHPTVADYLEEGLAADRPPHSHVHTMKALEHEAVWKASPIVRRGFPFRRDGREGLEFLGAARDPRVFELALGAMDRDALSGFVELDRKQSGVYFCPPYVASDAVASASDVGNLTDGLDHGPDMLDYSISTKDSEYWEALMKAGIFVGTPGEQKIDPRVRAALVAIHAQIDPENLYDLNRKLTEFEAASNAINARFRRYVTKG